MASNYPKGSEWRRWDLHIHTPESKLHNEFTNWDSYIEALKKADESVKVVGVTDYLTIDGYKILYEKIRKDEGAFSFDLVLPNIEFRITPFTKQGSAINIHILVDPQDNQHIVNIEQALGHLRFVLNDQTYSCKKDELINLGKAVKPEIVDDEVAYREGINQFKIDFATFRKWYNQEAWLKKNSLIAISNSNNDGASGLNHDDGYKATRQEIYRFCDIIFSGNPKDRTYFLGQGPDTEEKLKATVNGIKPCIHGSDAHKEEKLFKPDGERNCWIKADPTFEGLRQILYEPEERVRIQEKNPLYEFRKPYFSSLSMDGQVMIGGTPSFVGDVIPLNPGMVTLIGGRGTGKSVLLDCIYKMFHPSRSLNDERLEKIQPSQLNMVYTKLDLEEIRYEYGQEADLEYLHVRQGDIKKVADNPDKLSEQIKELLDIDVREEKPEYDYEIESIISRIEKSLAWFELEDSEGNLVNDKLRNEKIIKANQNLISTITTDENKENIEKYQNNVQGINNRTTSLNRLSELRTKISTYKLELKREIEDINTLLEDETKLPAVEFAEIESRIVQASKVIETEIKELTKSNEEIEKTFKEQGIDQDVGGLLKKLSQYQKEIDLAKEKLSEYEAKQKTVEDDIKERSKLVNRIDDDLKTQLQDIKKSFDEVSKGKESWSDDQKELVSTLLKGINIDGNIVFNVKSFYKGLMPLLNGQKFRSTNTESQEERVRSRFNVASYEAFIRLIKNEKIIDDGKGGLFTLNEFAVQKEYFVKSNYDIYEYLYLHRYRQTYLSVKPVIEYLGKSPEKLSVGQRGTFYVCMKLATDPFGSPFIFDQPEDDLDNKFIMLELVPLFRKIKKYRQVIIATHNANLVVNADAEQVIVANNDEEKLSYFSGAIENTENVEPWGVRENVCDILEGGQTAFEKRERKYGFER